MSSKTFSSKCLLSKAIVKADLKNNWPFAAASLIILFLNFISPLTSYYSPDRLPEYYYTRFMSYFSFSFFFALGFGIFLGIKLYAYLDKINSVSCMHGFPFTRRKLYFSHIFSGFLLTAIPAVLITILVICMSAGTNPMFSVKGAFSFLGTYMTYAFLGFGLSAFSMMICGNVVASGLFSVFIAAIPAALIGFFEYVCGNSFYGYVSSDLSLEILEFLYVHPTEIFPTDFITYLVIGLIFLVAGYFIYKIRPLENCEEVVAFTKMRAFFIFAVGLCAGMISYLFLCAVLGTDSLLTMLPLGIAGIIGANMFARKSVSLKGSGIYLLIFVIVVSGFAYALSKDFFGFETRIPEAEDVEYIDIESSGRDFYYYDVTYDELPDYKLYTNEEIEIVRALHAAYIADEDAVSSNSVYWSRNEIYSSNYIEFSYKLKNGTKVMRRYSRLSPENYEKYMMPFRDLEKVKYKNFGFIDDVTKEILEITVYDDRIMTPAVSFNRTDAQKLADALKEDILTLSTAQMTTEESALSLSVEFYAPLVDINGKRPNTFSEKVEYSQHTSVGINENFIHTISKLKALGYPVHDKEAFEKVEKISVLDTTPKEYNGDYYIYEDVAIYDYEYSSIGVTVEAEKYFDGVYGEKKYITERNDMWELYKLCGLGFENGITEADYPKIRRFLIQFIDSHGDIVYDAEFTVIVENLPENIAHYFRAG